MKQQVSENVPMVAPVRQDAFARSRSRQMIALVVLLIAVVGSLLGLRNVRAAATQQQAFIPSTNAIAPAPGKVVQVLVSPGELVRKGQLLAVLDTSAYDQQLQLAEADLKAAKALLPQTAAPVVTAQAPPALSGGVEKKAVLVPQPFPVAPLSVPASVVPSAANAPKPTPAESSKPSDDSAPESAAHKKAADKVATLQKAKQAASELISSDTEKLGPAMSDAGSSQALVQAAQTIVEKARSEKERSSSLLAQGAISANDAAKADNNYAQALGQLQAAKLKVSTAQDTVGQLESEIKAQQEVMRKTDEQLKKAISEAAAEPKADSAEPTGPTVTVPPSSLMPPAPKYRLVPVATPSAPVAPLPIQIDPEAAKKAQLEVQKAQAGVERVQKMFARCVIYAPADGRISAVLIRPGDTLKARQAAFTIDRGNR